MQVNVNLLQVAKYFHHLYQTILFKYQRLKTLEPSIVFQDETFS